MIKLNSKTRLEIIENLDRRHKENRKKEVKKLMSSWVNSNRKNERSIWMKKHVKRMPNNKTGISRHKTYLLNNNLTGTKF
ncbi:hypothetical protein LCGC14_1941560 [marine sediment metagenome]|uniref:Uncharacterized protein n=1 Tax=marine sediment metagenome TaxID=412755 RepID=A0A0F9FKG9_9ZZZZ